MKITNINAQNFIGLRHVDMDLSGHRAHLFAGPNGAGKSSLQEAVRFALLGEVARVALKKNYGDMIREGAKSGTVAITAQPASGDPVTFARDVKTGKGEGPMWEDTTLPYVLDAHRFAAMPENDRRTFLSGLFQVGADHKDIARRLERRGIAAGMVEQITPLLRAGFESAHAEAKKKVSEARAAWKAVTGEVYGAKKAETWAPEAVSYDESAHTAATERVGALEGSLADLQHRRGAAQQQAGRIAEAKAFAAALDEHRAALAQLEPELESAAEQRRQTAAARLSFGQVPQTMSCPCCGAPLMVRDGELVQVDDERPDQEAIAKSQQEAATADETYRKLRDQADELRRQIARGEQAQQLLAAAGASGTAEHMPTLDEAVASVRQELANARAEVQDYEAAKRDQETAAQRAETAAAHHAAAVAWSEAADALDPDGIPGELLAETLEPLNSRLRATADATGWPQVAIAADMAITAGGRAYNLLSESERWRVDAALAEAISHAAGLGVLVLDRVDVLDLSGRGQLIDWIGGLEQYETILLFGTFKALPFTEYRGIAGRWIEHGEIVDSSDRAA